jgi:hypothetical protein
MVLTLSATWGIAEWKATSETVDLETNGEKSLTCGPHSQNPSNLSHLAPVSILMDSLDSIVTPSRPSTLEPQADFSDL